MVIKCLRARWYSTALESQRIHLSQILLKNHAVQAEKISDKNIFSQWNFWEHAYLKYWEATDAPKFFSVNKTSESPLDFLFNYSFKHHYFGVRAHKSALLKRKILANTADGSKKIQN